MALEISGGYRRAESGLEVEVVIRDAVVAVSDPYLHPIALISFLDNVWKCTGKKEHPRIEFGMLKGEGESICCIRDNGVGFGMVYVGKPFGAFQWLHRTEEFLGTWIGPATVQRIIHRQGSRGRAKGDVGEGVPFFLALPG